MTKPTTVALLTLLSLTATGLAQTTRPSERMASGPATEPAAPSTLPPPITQPKPLVYVERGDLPIILSAPHGGRMKVPGAAVRTGGGILIPKGVKNTFTFALDANVDLIAQTLADDIEKRTGHRPYVVIANFGRRFVDANRMPEEGYEDEAGKTVYDQYHNAIKEFRTEIIHKWQRGLLLDIHGHGRPADQIIRGTADWTSVRHLVEEFGKDAVVGDDGLLGPLGKVPGYTFVPPLAETETPEYAALNGGYITREYGSYQGGGFDAVQLELGGNYRKPANIPAFADTLSRGVVRFMDKYLLVGKPATQPAVTPPATTRP